MKHWTENDFLYWIYAGEAAASRLDAGHLEDCGECRARLELVRQTRREAIMPPELSWEFLAAQRRGIYTRIGVEAGSRRSIAMRWPVAMAGLIGIVILSLAMLRPRAGTTALYNSSDEKLFSDLASIEQSSEPRAIRPIHRLFEE